MSSYRGRVQEIIRERAKVLSLSLSRLVGRYLLTLPGGSDTGPNRKKKRNAIDRIWRGSTQDPRLSTFLRIIHSLGGQVIIRWLDGEENAGEEVILSYQDFEDPEPDRANLKIAEQVKAVDIDQPSTSPTPLPPSTEVNPFTETATLIDE